MPPDTTDRDEPRGASDAAPPAREPASSPSAVHPASDVDSETAELSLDDSGVVELEEDAIEVDVSDAEAEPPPRAASVPPPRRAESAPPVPKLPPRGASIPAIPKIAKPPPRPATSAPPSRITTQPAADERELDEDDSGIIEVADAIDAASLDAAGDDSPASRLESPTALEKLLAAGGEVALEQQAELLQRDLDATTDKAKQALLAYELGELYERHLVDEARAVKAYGRALQTDPTLRPNLWAIRRIFYRRALWPNLIKLVDAEIRFATSDRERAELLCEKGIILAEKQRQPADAQAAFAEASAADPSLLLPLLELERIAMDNGDMATVAATWRRMVDASQSPERKVVHLLDLARLRSQEGDDGLALAKEALEEAAVLGVERERVIAEALRIAQSSGQSQDLLSALESQAQELTAKLGAAAEISEGASDRAIHLKHRVVAIRRRQAQLARRSELHEEAWTYLQEAMALAPGEPLLLADLTELAESQGRFAELAELTESWQAIEGDPTRALVLSLRRADALFRGGRRDAGLSLLHTLDASAPGYVGITSLVERDALANGDPAELARAYGSAGDALRLGSAFGPAVRAAPDLDSAAVHYVAAAHLWAHEVRGVEGDGNARALLGRALEVKPGYPAALEALIELHAAAGRAEEAIELLEQVAATDRTKQAPILERIAEIARAFGRDDLAVDAALRLWEARPEDRLLAWQIDAELAHLGRNEQRVDHLSRVAQAEKEPARRGLALATAARLAEGLGQAERAVALYRSTLEVWPHDRYSREAMLDLLRDAGRWEDLVAVRRKEAIELPDGPSAARALREAAWILEDQMNRASDAGEIWRQALDRFPEDAHALAGVIRTAAAAGDDRALADALERRLGDPAAGGATETAVRLGLAQERLGRWIEAGEAFEKASAGKGRSVAASIARVAMLDVAARRGEASARVEAATQLANNTSHPELAAALQEEVGWLSALVLEDFDQAADAFGAAVSQDGTRASAALGRALVAARRGDPIELVSAYQQLAAATATPAVAAGYHLANAALSFAGGDGEGALRRISTALAAAPDDSSALLLTAEYAAAPATPKVDEDESLRIRGLVAQADVFALRASYADSPVARSAWELDRAEALEAAGRLRESGELIVGVLRADATDLRALAALVRVARRAGDQEVTARAAIALAGETPDPDARLALLRQAVLTFDPDPTRQPRDPAAAAALYRRILRESPGASELTRLRSILAAHGDLGGELAALSDRLRHLEAEGDLDASVPLLIDRASLRAKTGDRHGASVDLDLALERSPDEPAALRIQAEVRSALGDTKTSAELWRRYLLAEPDSEARASGEREFARLLSEESSDLGAAIEQLEELVVSSPNDTGLHDRMIGLASRAEDWGRVAAELKAVIPLRANVTERVRDELRLGEILRDRLGDKDGAKAALERARRLDPLQQDAVQALADLAAPSNRRHVLEVAASDLRTALAKEPTRSALYERLATVTSWQGDPDATWLALVAVEALGSPTGDQRTILKRGRAQLVPLPSRALTVVERARLHPVGGDRVATELWHAIGPAVSTVAGFDTDRLGFTKHERIAAKNLGRGHEGLAATVQLFNLGDAELYVNESRRGVARVLSGEVPRIYVSADVAAGQSREARFQLGRIATLAADGTGTLAELRDAELPYLFAAAMHAAEAPLPLQLAGISAVHPQVGDRVAALQKLLGRKERKAIHDLAAHGNDLPDLLFWRRTQLGASYRSGLLLAGDLIVALEQLDVGRNGRAIAASPAALDLLVWSLSENHLALRRELGFALAGGKR